jgi:hypothetical protein
MHICCIFNRGLASCDFVWCAHAWIRWVQEHVIPEFAPEAIKCVHKVSRIRRPVWIQRILRIYLVFKKNLTIIVSYWLWCWKTWQQLMQAATAFFSQADVWWSSLRTDGIRVLGFFSLALCSGRSRKWIHYYYYIISM